MEGLKPLLENEKYIKKILYTEAFASSPLLKKSHRHWLVTEAIIRKISPLPSPPGIIGEMEIPPYGHLENLSRILVLDGLNDPGNLGTLLRTALSFGWQGVYVLPNTCDLFNEKVIRAARGAHFHLQFEQSSTSKFISFAIQNHFQVLIADPKGLPFHTVPLSEKIMLILGNESLGASEELKKQYTMISISMKKNVESLNVAIAGSILLYSLGKI